MGTDWPSLASPPGSGEARRFGHAVQAILWHELAILAAGVLVAALLLRERARGLEIPWRSGAPRRALLHELGEDAGVVGGAPLRRHRGEEQVRALSVVHRKLYGNVSE